MNYKLYYWPIPFRGDFIRVLLEEANESYDEASFDEIIELKSMSPEKQPLASMAPPFFHDLKEDVFINQMPAIVMYLSEKLGLLPQNSVQSAICLKLVLDSNDVLAEITNHNGSYMWEHEKWKAFRENRLKRWMEIFEQTSLQFGLETDRGFIFGKENLSTADLVVYALWGTMIRCLPELKPDFQRNASTLSALCQRIENRPNIKKFVEKQEAQYRNAYCGGQIEKSIRSMLKQDLS